MIDLLFVYGTLLRGAGHPMHQLLLEQSDFHSSGRLQARLYRVTDYPGAVLADHSDDWVQGEIYRLHHPLRLLTQLDRYEGCSPDDPQPQEYRREVQPIRLADGATLSAWVYLYQGDTTALPLIPSGDFLNR
ncbi:gamma-glutamylcyclotransferase family protein [Sedimenticola sp.]|uniref:gamma-glutamylcyclotransferase family protein n=1 Tax=Sedimenticola sp. TaxID=1940285 RepID=UPI003D1470B7